MNSLISSMFSRDTNPPTSQSILPLAPDSRSSSETRLTSGRLWLLRSTSTPEKSLSLMLVSSKLRQPVMEVSVISPSSSVASTLIPASSASYWGGRLDSATKASRSGGLTMPEPAAAAAAPLTKALKGSLTMRSGEQQTSESVA